MKSFKNAMPELIFRIVIGFIFIQSGWGKLHNLTGVISYFQSLGIPLANIQAPLVAGVELLAGLFILIGLATRISSLFLFVIMIVAIKTAKWEDITDLNTFLGLSEFLYSVILFHLMIFGAQYFSIDARMRENCKRDSCKKI